MAYDGRSWADQLSIVIPAFNEEGGIGGTLAALREALPTCELIVVDDGSTDETSERALAVPNVRLLKHSFNRGYGAALKTGMRAARRRYVAWFDADGEHRVQDLERMVERLAQEGLVAVIGRRRSAGPSRVRTYGKLAIRMLARTLGVDIGRDLNCGLRVFLRSMILRYLPLLPDAFSASMTSTMILIEQGLRFAFEDIETEKRIGTSKVQLADGFSTLALVLRMVMLFAPLRIFLGFGGLFLVGGSLYGVIRAVLNARGLPVAGLLMILTGVMLVMFGLVADQISRLRLSQFSVPGDEDYEELSNPATSGSDGPQASRPVEAVVRTERDAPS